jgi:hypothetical protein
MICRNVFCLEVTHLEYNLVELEVPFEQFSSKADGYRVLKGFTSELDFTKFEEKVLWVVCELK